MIIFAALVACIFVWPTLMTVTTIAAIAEHPFLQFLEQVLFLLHQSILVLVWQVSNAVRVHL